MSSGHHEGGPRSSIALGRHVYCSTSTVRRPSPRIEDVRGLLLLVPPRTPRSSGYDFYAHAVYVVICYMSITCICLLYVLICYMSVKCYVSVMCLVLVVSCICICLFYVVICYMSLIGRRGPPDGKPPDFVDLRSSESPAEFSLRCLFRYGKFL